MPCTLTGNPGPALRMQLKVSNEDNADMDDDYLVQVEGSEENSVGSKTTDSLEPELSESDHQQVLEAARVDLRRSQVSLAHMSVFGKLLLGKLGFRLGSNFGGRNS